MSLTCELILVGLATMATLALCYIAWLLASGLRTPARLPREIVAYQRAALILHEEQVAHLSRIAAAAELTRHPLIFCNPQQKQN